MADPNLPLLEDAVPKLVPFLDEIVFVGGVTLGLLITDEAAPPIGGTTDVDISAEILTYADYTASRNAHSALVASRIKSFVSAIFSEIIQMDKDWCEYTDKRSHSTNLVRQMSRR